MSEEKRPILLDVPKETRDYHSSDDRGIHLMPLESNNTGDVVDSHESAKDILSSIFYRECCRYVENPKKRGYCMCNYSEQWHIDKRIARGTGEWSSLTHTKLHLTNAYGEIRFHKFGRIKAGKKPRYVRMDALCEEYETLLSLLTKVWEIPMPELILSINGGAKSMRPLNKRIRLALTAGLADVSRRANTWFITSGFNVGVHKLLGEMQKSFISLDSDENEPTLIGFCTWGAVWERDSLLNSSECNETFDMQPKDYYNWPSESELDESVLDPHHDVFILLDDGTVNNYNKEVQFRSQFERFLASKGTTLHEDMPQIPLVQVIIEGGKNTIYFSHAALLVGTPVVFINGTGRCADLVCSIIQKVNSKNYEKSGRQFITDCLKRAAEDWGIADENEITSLHNLLTDIALKFSEEENIAHVYDVYDSDQDFLTELLKAAICSKHKTIDENGREEVHPFSASAKLKLAMMFDTVEIANTEIFAPDKTAQLKSINLEAEFINALKNGKTDFLELFLDTSISIRDALKLECLIEIYEHITKGNTLESQLLKTMLELEEEHYKGLQYCRTHTSPAKIANPHHRMLYYVGSLFRTMTNSVLPNIYDFEKYPLRNKISSPTNRKKIFGTDNFDDTQVAELIDMMREVEELSQETEIDPNAFPIYPPYSDRGDRQFIVQDLFLLAILLNEIEMVKLFWRLGKEHISSALIASIMFNSMKEVAEKNGEIHLATELTENSEFFRDIAVGTLQIAYKANRESAHQLLTRALPYWGRTTLLDIAYENDCLEFISGAACQTKLNKIWMGKMHHLTPVWLIFLNLFLAPILIRTIFPSTPVEQVSSKSDKFSNNLPPSRRGSRVYSQTTGSRRPSAVLQQEVIDGNSGSLKKTIGYFKSIKYFYSAPITKFMWTMVAHIVLLILFTDFVLIELKPMSAGDQPSWVEIICWIWVMILILDEMRQIIYHESRNFFFKLKQYFNVFWNKMDAIMYTFFLLAIALRFNTTEDAKGNGNFVYTRTFHAITLAMEYFRIMQYYLAHRTIGPKVVMIKKMMGDIIFFICILLVFLFAYGSASTSLLYPNQTPGIQTLIPILYRPYWQVLGELNLDEVEGSANGARYNIAVPAMFILYMIMANILLLNLLIAMFGYTFGKIQDASEKIWMYNRHGLIQECYERPYLPAPFSVFELFYMLAVYLNKRLRKEILPHDNDFKQFRKRRYNQWLTAIEQNCAEKYVSDYWEPEEVNDSTFMQPVEDGKTTDSSNICNFLPQGFTLPEDSSRAVFEMIQNLHDKMEDISEDLEHLKTSTEKAAKRRY